jgi:hypothetical protein
MERLTQGLVDTVFQAWHLVHVYVQSHEVTICAKWTAMTPQKRREILLRACSNMPERHRHDTDTLSRKGVRIENGSYDLYGFHDSTCFLAPFVNQEDLMRPLPFLQLLNSRGRHMPNKFASTELLYTSLAVWEKHDLWNRMPCHTTSFLYGWDAESYGSFEEYESREDAQDHVRSGRAVHPVQGIQILIIQVFIMRMLQECCEAILRDLDKHVVIAGIISNNPEPPRLDEASDAIFTADIMYDAPYRLPGRLDLARLRSLIAARIDELEEHVWTLRKDPGYFADLMQRTWEHNMNNLRDNEGKRTAIMHKSRQALMGYVLRDVVMYAYYIVHLWHGCQRELADVQALLDTHGGSFFP